MRELPRIVLGLSFASFCLPATTGLAATYYVDATRGDDARNAAQAQNIATPWRTIQKAADTMASGDTALIRAGTYRETVYPKSGQTFQADGDAKPLITGCDPVSGWTVHSGSIYKAMVNTTVYDVFVGMEYMQKARWPNEDGDPMTAPDLGAYEHEGKDWTAGSTIKTPPAFPNP